MSGTGEPVVQLSPPLVAGPEEFREMARILRQALSEAGDRMS
jgi:adenosylmethionine-8-amino-7-oxononanoate aminotransferase